MVRLWYDNVTIRKEKNVMDLTLLEKREKGGICYKLFKANFHYDCYVMLAQTKNEFYCGSFKANAEQANRLLNEIAESETEVYCISDILADFQKQTSSVL